MVHYMKDKVSVEEIIDLVNHIESQDPIDWGMLAIDENIATEMLVNQLVDRYNTEWITLEDQDKVKIFLASMSKLIIENFVLNVRLRQ